MLQRLAYKELQKWKSKSRRLPLVLSGARQTGKTFLIQEFAKKEFERFHYLNFEEDKSLKKIFEKSLKPADILELYSIQTGKQVNVKSDLLIFDEIQSCPDAITSLKYFAENLPELFLISAGSLLGLELSPVSYPVGKIEFLNIHPLSFYEFLLACKENDLLSYLNEHKLGDKLPEIVHAKAWQLLLNYMTIGGLPDCINTFLSAIKDKSRFQALIDTRKKQTDLIKLFLSDFTKHSGKENALHIERVFSAVPAQLAKAIDQSSDKFYFKDVINKQGRYDLIASPVSWLKKASLILQSFIIEKSEIPLNAYAKENRFKLYMFDTGILGALVNIPIQSILEQNFDNYKGFYAENFIAQEINYYYQQDIFSWTGRSAEVEFLISTNTGIVPVEVKAGKAYRAKSLGVYREKYKPQRSILFSSRPDTTANIGQKNEKGIKEMWPLYMSWRALKENSP